MIYTNQQFFKNYDTQTYKNPKYNYENEECQKRAIKVSNNEK